MVALMLVVVVGGNTRHGVGGDGLGVVEGGGAVLLARSHHVWGGHGEVVGGGTVMGQRPAHLSVQRVGQSLGMVEKIPVGGCVGGITQVTSAVPHAHPYPDSHPDTRCGRALHTVAERGGARQETPHAIVARGGAKRVDI